MNTADIYSKAIGRREDVVDQDKLLTAEMVQQQHEEWLRHPETIRLLNFLITRRSALQDSAADASCNKENEHAVMMLLNKAKAIKEIEEYARTEP